MTIKSSHIESTITSMATLHYLKNKKATQMF